MTFLIVSSLIVFCLSMISMIYGFVVGELPGYIIAAFSAKVVVISAIILMVSIFIQSIMKESQRIVSSMDGKVWEDVGGGFYRSGDDILLDCIDGELFIGIGSERKTYSYGVEGLCRSVMGGGM